MLRSKQVNYKTIVANVLRCRDDITAKKNDIIKIPSVIRAEFTRERENLDTFRRNLRDNIQNENVKNRQKFNKLKKKYDKEGVQVVDDQREIGRDS